MKPTSQIIEETRKAYIDNLKKDNYDVVPGDQIAIVFLASTILNDLNKSSQEGNRMNARIDTMVDWAKQYNPESVRGIKNLFGDPVQARSIARVIFASVKPAGSYEPEQLLEGLQAGDVLIDWKPKKL